MVKPWSWLRSLTSALIVMTPSMGIWGNSLALAQELPPTNLDTYIGNWELFVIEEDVGLQYQGGVLMEQSHQRLMGLVFLELEDGLVGMLELEPQGPEEFIGRMWMFDLQLKPVEQQSITSHHSDRIPGGTTLFGVDPRSGRGIVTGRCQDVG